MQTKHERFERSKIKVRQIQLQIVLPPHQSIIAMPLNVATNNLPGHLVSHGSHKVAGLPQLATPTAY